MSSSPEDPVVALVREDPMYPSAPPFDPSEQYPEWPDACVGGEDNAAYRGVRAALHALGLDQARFGTPQWNPFGDIVRPGDHVLLKPNFVSHRNLLDPVRGDTDCLVTHGSVIRAVLDYTAKALNGRGTITIADCPIQSTDWDALLGVVGVPEIVGAVRRAFPAIPIEVIDCRLGVSTVRAGGAVERSERTNDAAAVELELGSDSLLVPITRAGHDFGVTHYGRRRMRAAHTPTRHAYLIGRRFLECDVFLNLPKLKSHQKAGVTCALKNLVGINAHKDYLPHFRFGSPSGGGDEYPDGNWFWHVLWWLRHQEWERDRGRRKQLWAFLARAATALLPVLAGRPRAATSLGGGGWHGNDTLWRTVLDINRLLFHRAARRGVPAGASPGLRYLAIVDGLIGGDRESPLFPSRVASGVILAGRNPVAVDVVAATVMGFDWHRIPQLREAFSIPTLPLAVFEPDEIRVRSNGGEAPLVDVMRENFVPFVPSFGYRGHIERAPADRAAADRIAVTAHGNDSDG
jgi:uncharacterized protein (DUF362 family)